MLFSRVIKVVGLPAGSLLNDDDQNSLRELRFIGRTARIGVVLLSRNLQP